MSMPSLLNRDRNRNRNRIRIRMCTATLAAVILICCDCGGENAMAQELIYPGQAKSERDLSTCEPYEICSVVHKRYWFTNKVERLCRCDSHRQECSTSWTEWTVNAVAVAVADPYTMTVNNRAQMKFCEPVTALPNCLETDASGNADTNWTRTTSPSPAPAAQQRFLNVVNETRTETINNVTAQNYKLTSKAQCYCPPHNTWIAHAFRKNDSLSATATATATAGSGSGSGSGSVLSYTWTSYRCSQLAKCKAGDMCGFERADFYSNYYKCSCPRGNVCTRHSRPVTLQVNELLYEGAAFVAHCQNKNN